MSPSRNDCNRGFRLGSGLAARCWKMIFLHRQLKPSGSSPKSSFLSLPLHPLFLPLWLLSLSLFLSFSFFSSLPFSLLVPLSLPFLPSPPFSLLFLLHLPSVYSPPLIFLFPTLCTFLSLFPCLSLTLPSYYFLPSFFLLSFSFLSFRPASSPLAVRELPTASRLSVCLSVSSLAS